MIPTKPLTKRQRVLACVLLVLVAVTALLAHQHYLPVGLSWNGTASLPIGLYWHTKADGKPRYGDISCFPYKPPEWAQPRNYFPRGFLLCKRVLGLPGDAVVARNDRLEICRPNGECQDAGRVVTHDSAGMLVPPISLPSTIPVRYAYMGVPESRMSFDSRYLGLIAINDLKRTIHPLWIVAPAAP
jgi:conjugative transfer signal peptidase TraF